MHYKHDIDKIGNTIIFLAERIGDLSKTKLLKILYMLDEISVKEYGLPFLNIRYEVWKLGPVAQEIFVDLSTEEPVILKDYIVINVEGGNRTYISPKKEFNDDEFSTCEINLLEKLTESVKNSPAYVLVDQTHKKDSLWYNTARRNNLLDLFDEGKKNSSNIELDFQEIIKDDPMRLSIYTHHQQLQSSMNSFRIE